jgi:hypothetical protein
MALLSHIMPLMPLTSWTEDAIIVLQSQLSERHACEAVFLLNI